MNLHNFSLYLADVAGSTYGAATYPGWELPRIRISKYRPHQGAKECARRRKQFPMGLN